MTNQEMPPLQVLQEARQLLSNPDHWFRYGFAGKKDGEVKARFYSKNGEPSWLHPDANCWCSMGALLKVTKSKIPTCPMKPIFFLSKALDKMGYSSSIAWFNDNISTTHEDILELFDLAIELAKEDHARQ